MNNILKLSNTCQLEYTTNDRIALCYIDHSPDRCYKDRITEIDLDRARAEEVIVWLCEKIDLDRARAEEIIVSLCEKYQLSYDVMFKTETTKMNLYKEVLIDLVGYAELEKDREQSYVVLELFKNRFKRQSTLIGYVWEISNKIKMMVNNLR